MQKPKSWAEAEKLVGAPELERLLTIRLIELAFTQETAVALRAIEMLEPRLGVGADNPLSEISDVELMELTEVVGKRLRTTAVAGRGVSPEDGAGAP